MSFESKCVGLGWPESRFGGPRIIGHRGACYHATENTLQAFELATKLGADMWEIDVRNTADGVCVVSHDDNLSSVFGVDMSISECSATELADLENVSVPTLQEVITLADCLGAGLYIEIKGKGAGPAAMKELLKAGFGYAALGSFNPIYIAQLAEADCPYPLSVLVRVGEDPFDLACQAKADAVHLCWERACDRPDRLLTPDLMARAIALDLPLILWHEERTDVIRALMTMDIAGVCSDRPELLVPYANSPSRPSDHPEGAEVVCHRGCNKLAPENTLPAATLAFEQGFGHVEVDVRESADGQLVIMHDDRLDRTTNGTGPVAENSFVALGTLDAGSWFAPRFSGLKIPTLGDLIDVAKASDKGLYIEIKKADPAKVIALVEQKRFLDHCFFWSFDDKLIDGLRQLSPKAQIMVRSLDVEISVENLHRLRPSIVEINLAENDIEDKIHTIREAGCQVMLCYMGNDMDVIQHMITLAPDLVNLDNPQLWKEAWHEHCVKLTGKTNMQ